jgi:hypothetical protein
VIDIELWEINTMILITIATVASKIKNIVEFLTKISCSSFRRTLNRKEGRINIINNR